jgi:hypothetical protein
MPLLCCRQRDTEIAALRGTLSERDSKLQDSRSELAELHAQIKDSEDGLQQAYNQLAEASRDRARVRQQLLQNQAELSGVTHSAMSVTLIPLIDWISDTVSQGYTKLQSLGKPCLPCLPPWLPVSQLWHKTLTTHLPIPWTDSEVLCPVHVVMQITVAGAPIWWPLHHRQMQKPVLDQPRVSCHGENVVLTANMTYTFTLLQLLRRLPDVEHEA